MHSLTLWEVSLALSEFIAGAPVRYHKRFGTVRNCAISQNAEIHYVRGWKLVTLRFIFCFFQSTYVVIWKFIVIYLYNVTITAFAEFEMFSRML